MREKFVSESWTWGSRVAGIVSRCRCAISEEDVEDEPGPCRELDKPFAVFPGDATLTGERSCLSKSLNSLVNCLKNCKFKKVWFAWRLSDYLFLLIFLFYSCFSPSESMWNKEVLSDSVYRSSIQSILIPGSSAIHWGSSNGTGTFSEKNP